MNEVTKMQNQDVQHGDAPSQSLMPADPMISMIERVAMDPNSDLAKLERMLELKEKHDSAQARAEFAAAFAKASSEFPTIPLNGKGHNGLRYATLEDITKKTRPVLSSHGLAMTFAIEVGDQITVTAKLMHKAGHVETTSIALPRDTSGSKNAVQAVGSSQTYGQRYTAQAILGLSLGEDTEDDGNNAGGTKFSPITADQYRTIRDLLDQTEIPEQTVLTAAKVSDLHDLSEGAAQTTIKRLQKTLESRKGAN